MRGIGAELGLHKAGRTRSWRWRAAAANCPATLSPFTPHNSHQAPCEDGESVFVLSHLVASGRRLV